MMNEKIITALSHLHDVRSAIYAIGMMCPGLGSDNGYGLFYTSSHALPHIEEIETILNEMMDEMLKANEPQGLPFVEPEAPKTKKKKEATPRKKVDHGKIVALHKAGWSGANIADEMNISQGVVSTHLKAAREKGEL